MSTYQDFCDGLLPGNYALTKSMELTKIQTSGTLWYSKKFLVLYYYIFLSNDIFTRAYIADVIRIFDRYISSLDEKVRAAAEAFFYPENDTANFKADGFRSFLEFAGKNDFANPEQRKMYYQNARKYYFALLMGAGGQRGVKKRFKEAVCRADFVYSDENVQKAILDAVICVCADEANAQHKISDNSVKYILSEDAMTEICRQSEETVLTYERIQAIIARYPRTQPQYNSIKSDMVAFIRNERQILYYFGYVHSKSSGANDFEFSSLTPVGELALWADSMEFLAIWEHQKLKMISQPATAEINDVPKMAERAQRFAVSYTPYTDIIGQVLRRGSLTLEQYQYVVSRKKHMVTKQAWEEAEQEILNHTDDIRRQVHAFGRRGDQKDEDGRKELLKYLLGIRSDLPKDGGANPLGICSFYNAVIPTNEKALALLYRIYTSVDEYKIKRYAAVLAESEQDLRRRYTASAKGENSSIDGRVKIRWDLYNMHADRFVMLAVMIAIAACALQTEDLVLDFDLETGNQSGAFVSLVVEYARLHFRGLLHRLGIWSERSAKTAVQNAVKAITTGDYAAFMQPEEEREELTEKVRCDSAADVLEKIRRISKAAGAPTEGRKRNASLVSLLKTYYMLCFAENGRLKCECCGSKTFLTEAGEPYVEFHHLIPFHIAFGPDHYYNLFALCPNCHRKLHFLRAKEREAEYKKLEDNNYLHLRFAQRLIALKEERLLKSYHLEYLLAENAITQDEYNDIIAA